MRHGMYMFDTLCNINRFYSAYVNLITDSDSSVSDGVVAKGEAK